MWDCTVKHIKLINMTSDKTDLLHNNSLITLNNSVTYLQFQLPI